MEAIVTLTALFFYFGFLILMIYINYRIIKRAVRLGIKEAFEELKDKLKN